MGNAKKENEELSAALSPLLEPLAALIRLLEKYEYRGVIIGGIAASLLGQPRLTADLDAVIISSIQDIPKLIGLANQESIIVRIAEGEAFARKNWVLLMQHSPSGIWIDISLGLLPFEVEMVERAKVVDLGKLAIRLPTPEDLIIMKAIAHRPKDLNDIRAIAQSHPDLDRVRIRLWLEQFGEALDLPELWVEISKLL